MSGVTRTISILILCAAFIGMGWWLWRVLCSPLETVDPVAVFLEQHWKKPLAAQGVPPAHFSSLEGSLAPQACAECHAEQHRDWSSSLHSQTMTSGILWQARVLPPAEVMRCLDCHAPLAEQKALLAQALDWPDAPASGAPGYVPADLHQQGLVCAACHVRGHERFGPPPTAGKPRGDTPNLPHGGFHEATAFSDSRFCATCHQFPEDGPALNGKLLENTLNEWQLSRHAREGRTCQSCHMPERRHLWRGIHDPEMVRQALSTELSVVARDDGHIQVRAELRNSGTGHYFPTYLVPKVWLRLVAVDAAGTERMQLASTVISRETDIWLSKELSDSRIAPDAVRVLEGAMPAPATPGWRIELHMDVAPREHYERMFESVLRNSSVQLDDTARGILEMALAEARASRYSVPILQRALALPIAN